MAKSRGRAYDEAWKCTCNGCSKEYTYGDENSPVVYPRVWRSICSYWGISEEQEHRRNQEYIKIYKTWSELEDGDEKQRLFVEMRKPEYHTFFCTTCMEKALGRKLNKSDVDFRLQYNKMFFEKFEEEKGS